MRKYITSKDPVEVQENTLYLIEELPTGVQLLGCGLCNNTITISDEMENCPKCGGDLLFATWCDW